MLRGKFNLMLTFLHNISVMQEPKRSQELNSFMSMGFMFLELTESQAGELKKALAVDFPDIYKEYDEPDENECTSEFMYLRFK